MPVLLREAVEYLYLTTLERRCERGDLIKWFKIEAHIDKAIGYVGSIIKVVKGG